MGERPRPEGGVLHPRWSTGSPPPGARTATPGSTTATDRAATISVPGVIALTFGYANLAADLTASQAYRAIPGSSAVVAQIADQQWFRGSVLGLKLRSNEAKTAGTATFGFVIGTETQAGNLTWTTGNTRELVTWAKGTYPFDAGEDLYPIVTTDSAFTPTTVDVEVTLLVSFEPE